MDQVQKYYAILANKQPSGITSDKGLEIRFESTLQNAYFIFLSLSKIYDVSYIKNTGFFNFSLIVRGMHGISFDGFLSPKNSNKSHQRIYDADQRAFNNKETDNIISILNTKIQKTHKNIEIDDISRIVVEYLSVPQYTTRDFIGEVRDIMGNPTVANKPWCTWHDDVIVTLNQTKKSSNTPSSRKSPSNKSPSNKSPSNKTRSTTKLQKSTRK
jgi:hypothetical protein